MRRQAVKLHSARPLERIGNKLRAEVPVGAAVRASKNSYIVNRAVL